MQRITWGRKPEIVRDMEKMFKAISKMFDRL